MIGNLAARNGVYVLMRWKTPNTDDSGIADFVAAAGILLALALAGQWSFGDYYSFREQESIQHRAPDERSDVDLTAAGHPA
jgi:hypothetical protein